MQNEIINDHNAQSSVLRGQAPQSDAHIESWEMLARPEQKPPRGEWLTWLVMAGRGFGKTRTGAETIRQWVQEGRSRSIALIGETERETRQVMIEGPSGILSVHAPQDQLTYEPSKRQIIWPNGAKAYCYSGDKPNQLRGPQFDTAWVDELAKFNNPERMWEQLMFCLRLGKSPSVIVTTTPRPDPLLKELIKDCRTVLTQGATFENKKNLSPSFLRMMKERYLNTRLGRQELMAEVLEDETGALWNQNMIAGALDERADLELRRIVVSIDPAMSSNMTSDETGLIVAGVSSNGRGVVLEDLSMRGSPMQWASTAVEAYHKYGADRIVAEINMGGDLVEQMLRSVDLNVSYRGVRATRGKMIRAEPIAALYEQGKISHIKRFPSLERQLLSYIPGQARASPDRMDALVWAFTDLVLNEAPQTPLHVWSC